MSANAAAGPSGSQPSEATQPIIPPRIRGFRACESCRRRKIKCQGTPAPCGNCISAKLECAYKEISDKAAFGRQQNANIENRLASLESLLKPMSSNMGLLLERLSALTSTDQLVQPSAPSAPVTRTTPTDPIASISPAALLNVSRSAGEPHLQEDLQLESSYDHQFGEVLKDRRGNLRYLGGASNSVLVEALAHLETARSGNPNSPTRHEDDGLLSGRMPLTHPTRHRDRIDKPTTQASRYGVAVDLPSTDYSQALVSKYFELIHPTTPLLYEPEFMSMYHTLITSPFPHLIGQHDPASAALLFAVFASTARMVEGFSTDCGEEDGLRFYETSLELHNSCAMASSLKNVQTLGVLSITLSATNFVAQAYLLSGQAARACYDLALHRSPAKYRMSLVQKEIRRRVFWGIYSVDKIISITMGRPSGIDDDEVDCEYPLDINDRGLDVFDERVGFVPQQSCILGFISLCQILVIAGKIIKSGTKLHQLASSSQSDKKLELKQLVDSLEKELISWSNSLSDGVKKSVAERNSDGGRNPMFALCLICMVIYHSSMINLYRPFIKNLQRVSANLEGFTTLSRCISAARSCVLIAGLIREGRLPGHFLAFTVQYLTVSGVILVRSISFSSDTATMRDFIGEVEKVVAVLNDLESSWPGSIRGADMLVELVESLKQKIEKEGDGRLSALVTDSMGHMKRGHGDDLDQVSEGRFTPRPRVKTEIPTSSDRGQHQLYSTFSNHPLMNHSTQSEQTLFNMPFVEDPLPEISAFDFPFLAPPPETSFSDLDFLGQFDSNSLAGTDGSTMGGVNESESDEMLRRILEQDDWNYML